MYTDFFFLAKTTIVRDKEQTQAKGPHRVGKLYPPLTKGSGRSGLHMSGGSYRQNSLLGRAPFSRYPTGKGEPLPGNRIAQAGPVLPFRAMPGNRAAPDCTSSETPSRTSPHWKDSLLSTRPRDKGGTLQPETPGPAFPAPSGE
jgi:hypothetical protein